MHRRRGQRLSSPTSTTRDEKGPVVREFLKGAVRLHILHHAADGEVHGAWMSRELAHHGYTISPGTLYPTLHRMETEGLLTSEQRVVDGRTRRIYHATPAGHEALAADRTALAELAHEVLDTPHPAATTHTNKPDHANS
jgi:DNA-binding PadR family transcriptional regulator